MKYLISLMPKSYTIVSSLKLTKAKPAKQVNRGADEKGSNSYNNDMNEDYEVGNKRVSRVKKTRDFGNEYPAQTVAKVNKNSNEGFKRCEMILNQLCSHKYSSPFLEPVDPVALQIPDYFSIVKEPMDMGTVRRKLKGREYKTPAGFVADIKRIWANSFLYNPKTSTIHHMTVEMSDYFDKLNRDSGDVSATEEIGSINQKFKETSVKVKEYSQKLVTKTAPPKPMMSDKPMTYEEKRSLSEMIRSKTW